MPECYDSTLWIANSGRVSGVSVVEGPLHSVLSFGDALGAYLGQVYAASHDDESKFVGGSEVPWMLRVATDDDRTWAVRRVCWRVDPNDGRIRASKGCSHQPLASQSTSSN